MKFSKDRTRLFVMTSELSKGAKISNNEKNDIILTYPDGSVIRCDQRIRTEDVWISWVKAFGVLKDGGGLAHLGYGNKVDSTELQEQPKLAEPVLEKKERMKSEPINE